MNRLNLFREILRSGFQSLGGHGFRTFLTLLGISIGIFTITTILTALDSLQFTVTRNLSSLGNTVIFVHNWPWKDNSSDWHRYFNRPKVSYRDFEMLKQNLEDVEGVSYHIRANAQTLKYAGNSLAGVDVMAVTYDYGTIFNLDIAEGRYFSPVESEVGRPVCILGIDVAETLLGQPPYEGSEIIFRGRKMRVIGVVKRQGKSLFGPSMDEQMFIPYSMAAKWFNLNSRRLDKLITIKANKYEDLARIEGETIGLVRRARALKPHTEDNFSINKQEMLMNQIGQFFLVFAIAGWFISAFSILVGGFGIGNIMYAVVKERTFEIGLMKSVGATSSFVLWQFLVEAILLCLAGGMFGMFLLWILAVSLQQVIESSGSDFTIVLGPANIAIGLGVSMGIGLLFGFLPAWYASRLQPVDALRTK